MDPALTAIFAGLFAAGAAATIAIVRKTKSLNLQGDPNPALNGASRDGKESTGRFVSHSVEQADISVAVATIESAVLELYSFALEERRLRAGDKLRNEAIHSLATSVEMVAIQNEQAVRERREI